MSRPGTTGGAPIDTMSVAGDTSRENDHVDVVFVGGEGRSGSTVLANALARQHGFVAVGELHGVWQAVKTNELCSCGLPFHDCEFWRAVGRTAYGGWDQVDLPSVLTWNDSLTRHRFFYRIVSPWRSSRSRAQIEQYSDLLASLYRAVAQVAGCNRVLDSSKDPPYAFLLREIDSIDLRVLHLVRDCRGVAYSWAKATVERPEYRDHPTLSGTFMNTRGPARTAVEWCVKNCLFDILEGLGVSRTLVRYEVLASDPAATLDEIVQHLPLTLERGERTSGVQATDARQGDADAQVHMVGGNRVRFDRGGIQEIQLDDEWRRMMAPGRRLTVGAISFPFLARYGYVRGLRWAAVRDLRPDADRFGGNETNPRTKARAHDRGHR